MCSHPLSYMRVAFQSVCIKLKSCILKIAFKISYIQQIHTGSLKIMIDRREQKRMEE